MDYGPEPTSNTPPATHVQVPSGSETVGSPALHAPNKWQLGYGLPHPHVQVKENKRMDRVSR